MSLTDAAPLADDTMLASMAAAADAGSCWIVTPSFDTTNVAPFGAAHGFAPPVPPSVESTIGFAQDHYEDLLRRLAD